MVTRVHSGMHKIIVCILSVCLLLATTVLIVSFTPMGTMAALAATELAPVEATKGATEKEDNYLDLTKYKSIVPKATAERVVFSSTASEGYELIPDSDISKAGDGNITVYRRTDNAQDYLVYSPNPVVMENALFGYGGIFGSYSKLIAVDLMNTDFSKVTSLSNLFYYCTSLTEVDLTPLSGMTQVTTLSGLFYKCSSLTEIDLTPLSGMTQVTTLSYMFKGCSSLTEIDLTPLSGMTRVTNLSDMFYNCSSLAEIDLTPLSGMTQVATLQNMFNGCSFLTEIDLAPLSDMTQVKNLMGMFYNCSSLTEVDLTPLSGMTQVTTLGEIFYGCTSLTEIDLAPLSGMTQVTTLSGLFYDCRSLTEIDLTPLSKVLPKANVTSMFIGSRSSLEKVVFPAHEGTSDKTFKFFNAFSEANANTAGSTSFTWAAGSEAVTLYRVYGQVRFDAVGGSSENETRYYTAGDTWEIQDASRSGYLFGGW